MNIFIISLFCFAFSCILLGFMVFSKRRDKLGNLWFIYSTVCGLWAVGYSFQINNAVDYHRALIASRFADAIAIFIPVAWLRFVYEFLGLKANKKLFIPLYVVSFLLLLTAPTSLFIKGFKNKSNIGFDHFVAPGPAFDVFTLLFVSVVVYAFYLTLRFYFKKDFPAERKGEMRFFILANSIGFLGGSPAFLPVYDIDLPIAYSTLLMPFFPFLMAFAITKYRLLDVEELAKAAHRDKLAAIGTLTASINHEIKNPLYVIQGLAQSYLTNLEEGVYSSKDETISKSAEIAEKTSEQATRAMEIMKRFAMFAKQGINEKAQIESIDLNKTMEEVIGLVRHEMEFEKIELAKEIPAGLSPVRADRRHMEEILFNLIVNACQAMKNRPDDKKANKIQMAAWQHNGSVQIKIQDNGPGIPSDKLSRIFEPFYTTKDEGTGLGLYVTKQLVEKNGGKISVQSKLNEGTRFVLEFKR